MLIKVVQGLLTQRIVIREKCVGGSHQIIYDYVIANNALFVIVVLT